MFFRVDCFFLKMPSDAKDLAADLKGVTCNSVRRFAFFKNMSGERYVMLGTRACTLIV